MGECLFLIEKRGLYYRPQSAGYTGVKAEAGRYTFDEAAVHAGPNGPDGSQDGIVVWRESEAPEYSKACAWDVRLNAEVAKERARAEAAEAEVERLRERLSDTPALVLDALAEIATQATLAMSDEAVRSVTLAQGDDPDLVAERVRAIIRAAIVTTKRAE